MSVVGELFILFSIKQELDTTGRYIKKRNTQKMKYEYSVRKNDMV